MADNGGYYGVGESPPSFTSLNGKHGSPNEVCRFCTNSVMYTLVVLKGYSALWCSQCGALKEATWRTSEDYPEGCNKSYKEEWSCLDFDSRIESLAKRVLAWIEKNVSPNSDLFFKGDWSNVFQMIVKEELGLAPKIPLEETAKLSSVSAEGLGGPEEGSDDQRAGF